MVLVQIFFPGHLFLFVSDYSREYHKFMCTPFSGVAVFMIFHVKPSITPNP